MKIERAKKGAIIRNKANGHLYEVVEKENGIFAVALNMEEPEVVALTENNCIVFRMITDADPEVPNAELHENVLCVNGNSIESGFEFERILTKIPGAVFLLSGKSIIGYWPAVDKFKLIAEDVEDLFEKAAGDPIEGDSIVFAIQKSKTEKKEISEGTYQEETHYSCGVIHVRNGNTPKIERYDPVDDFRIESVSFDGKHSLVNGTRSDDSYVTLLDGEYLLEGKYTSVAGTFYTGNRLLLKGEGMILFSEYETERIVSDKAFKHFEKDLDGFNLLVDITKKENITTYALANEAYEVKFLSKKATKDRGIIYTIS